jgi:hypothetical protein
MDDSARREEEVTEDDTRLGQKNLLSQSVIAFSLRR